MKTNPGPYCACVSDAVRVASLLLIGPTVLFGLYVVAHGQVTPGGGFQGGVILSTAPLLLYLCADYHRFRRAVPQRFVEVSESIGAAAYILIGGACVALGGLFLQNSLPLGKSGSLTSGGIVPFIDLGVGLEVSGGLALALLAVPRRTGGGKGTMSYLPYAVAAWLFLVGLYGVISSRNLIHLVICVGVIQSSSYVLLLSIGYRAGRVAPMFADIPANTPRSRSHCASADADRHSR